jgi:superfamily II DNA/RNA helicase
MRGGFERATLLEDVKYIHGRENFSYRVEVCDEEEMDEWICRMVEGALEDMGGEGRAMVVFCKSRSRCESLGMRLECGSYHAGVDGKAERLESWVSGENRVMVATGALGTGVDVSDQGRDSRGDTIWDDRVLSGVWKSGTKRRESEIDDSIEHCGV